MYNSLSIICIVFPVPVLDSAWLRRAKEIVDQSDSRTSDKANYDLNYSKQGGAFFYKKLFFTPMKGLPFLILKNIKNY